MVHYVLDAAVQDDVRATIVVIGHHATAVEKELSERWSGARLTFVEQSARLGTGHAVRAAMATVDDAIGDSDGDVLIVPGDAPLLRRESVAELLAAHRATNAALTVLSAHVADPTGYGRIVHAKDDSVEGIVEERDASAVERAIDEVNTSVMVVRQSLLGPGLRRVGRQNAQGEYYLTDLVAVLHDMGHATRALRLDDADEAMGVNDQFQLARAERVLRQRINDGWLERGVTMWDPATTYVDADVELAPDVSLLPGTVLRGHCVIARGARIGPHAHLVDVAVGENAVLGAVDATALRVGADARVASFVVRGPGEDVRAGEIILR